MKDTSEWNKVEDRGGESRQNMVADVEFSQEQWCYRWPQALADITVPVQVT